MLRESWRSHMALVLMSFVTLFVVGTSHAQTLLDDFNNSATWTGSGGTNQGTLWRQYDNSIKYGRTTFGNLATAGTEGSTNFIRLKVDSNGSDTTYPFVGAEMNTLAFYNPPAVGQYVEWQARLRFLSADGGSTSGVVGAFWTYRESVNGSIRSSDEIDAEFLGKRPWELLTTNFNDFQRYNTAPNSGTAVYTAWYQDQIHHTNLFRALPSGLSYANWFWVRLRWYRLQNVSINGVSTPVFQVTWALSPNSSSTPPTDYTTMHRTISAAPDELMQLKLNIWVPDQAEWDKAAITR